MFPWWEQAFALGAAASSPVRTENQGARRPSFTSRHCEGTTSSCVGQEADKHKQRLLPLSRRKDAGRPPARIAAHVCVQVAPVGTSRCPAKDRARRFAGGSLTRMNVYSGMTRK